MKQFLSILMLLFSLNIVAQTVGEDQKVKIGDTFEIGSSENSGYQDINFPRANFIIKRGGIADYQSQIGKKVVVSSIDAENDGRVKITIERTDGIRFFRTHKKVSVNLSSALESGELKRI